MFVLIILLFMGILIDKQTDSYSSNYVTRFPENQSESRIVRLIGNRFLGSSAWFKTPTNWLSVIIDHRNTTTHDAFLFQLYYNVYTVYKILSAKCYIKYQSLQSPPLMAIKTDNILNIIVAQTVHTYICMLN